MKRLPMHEALGRYPVMALLEKLAGGGIDTRGSLDYPPTVMLDIPAATWRQVAYFVTNEKPPSDTVEHMLLHPGNFHAVELDAEDVRLAFPEPTPSVIRTTSNLKAEAECTAWLKGLPETPRRKKPELCAEAIKLFPPLTKTAFMDRVWAAGVPDAWKNPGAPRKTPAPN